jgi:hypothetical protein
MYGLDFHETLYYVRGVFIILFQLYLINNIISTIQWMSILHKFIKCIITVLQFHIYSHLTFKEIVDCKDEMENEN